MYLRHPNRESVLEQESAGRLMEQAQASVQQQEYQAWGPKLLWLAPLPRRMPGSEWMRVVASEPVGGAVAQLGVQALVSFDREGQAEQEFE